MTWRDKNKGRERGMPRHERDPPASRACRSSFEPALADLEERRARAVQEGRSVHELDLERDALLNFMWPGLASMPPCSNCFKRGHEAVQCPRPRRRREGVVGQGGMPRAGRGGGGA